MSSNNGNLKVGVTYPGDIYAASVKQIVPLQIWNGVKLQRHTSRGLSVFERFTIEALLQLGTCSAGELSEITGIEEGLSAWWLDGAELTGLANRIGEQRYAANIEQCIEAASSGAVMGVAADEITIAWFPVSNDFIALGQGDELVRTLSRVRPVASYPVPEQDSTALRSDLLNSALSKGCVYGVKGASIQEFDVDDVRIGEVIPSFLMEIELPDEGATDTQVVFYTESGGKKESGKKGKLSKSLIRESCRIPLMQNTTSDLRHLSDSIFSKAVFEIEQGGLISPRKSRETIMADMSREWAVESAKKGRIDRHPRISITLNREVHLELSCDLSATDDIVKSMMALDDAVGELLSAEDMLEKLNEVIVRTNVPQEELIERLWQLSEFGAVYRIRELEDFA